MGACASKPKVKKDVAADSPDLIKAVKAEANLLGAHDALHTASPGPKVSKEPSLKAINVSLPTLQRSVDPEKAVEASQLSAKQLEKLTTRAIVDEYQQDAIILKDSFSRIEEVITSLLEYMIHQLSVCPTLRINFQ